MPCPLHVPLLKLHHALSDQRDSTPCLCSTRPSLPNLLSIHLIAISFSFTKLPFRPPPGRTDCLAADSHTRFPSLVRQTEHRCIAAVPRRHEQRRGGAGHASVPVGAQAAGPGAAGCGTAGVVEAAGGVRQPGAHPVALAGHRRDAAAGNCEHIPAAIAAVTDRSRLQPRVQRAGAAAVCGQPRGDAGAVPQRAHPALLVPVSEHRIQDATVRVLAPDLTGGHRRSGQGGRPRGDQFLAVHGDHPALSAHYGDRLGAEQDRGHLYRAEDPAGRQRAELRVSDGGALLCGEHGVVHHGDQFGGAAIGPAAQAHHPVLPAAERQPASARGAATVSAASAAGSDFQQVAAGGCEHATVVGVADLRAGQRNRPGLRRKIRRENGGRPTSMQPWTVASTTSPLGDA
eukprot:ctg_818.g338